jgi:hypothetical protein
MQDKILELMEFVSRERLIEDFSDEELIRSLRRTSLINNVKDI